MTLFTLTDDSTLGEIQEVLCNDGYPSDRQTAKKVKRAFGAGTLVWTVDHLRIVGDDRIDWQPRLKREGTNMQKVRRRVRT